MKNMRFDICYVSIQCNQQTVYFNQLLPQEKEVQGPGSKENMQWVILLVQEMDYRNDCSEVVQEIGSILLCTKLQIVIIFSSYVFICLPSAFVVWLLVVNCNVEWDGVMVNNWCHCNYVSVVKYGR